MLQRVASLEKLARLKGSRSAKTRVHTVAVVHDRAAAKYERFSRAHGCVTYQSCDCLCAPLESGANRVLCMYVSLSLRQIDVPSTFHQPRGVFSCFCLFSLCLAQPRYLFSYYLFSLGRPASIAGWVDCVCDHRVGVGFPEGQKLFYAFTGISRGPNFYVLLSFQ